jgi:pimeloyl-ACP methyl ester carboxylesterase
MPIVLVHGNPETSAIWDEMRKQLDRTDVIALSPPGFGAPVPEGFTATSDAYVGWLALEVQKLDSPVDLVGHDWGGGHVARLACSRPELIRSWATDIAGCFDPDYAWHDLAQVWQTPGAGEAAVSQMTQMPAADRKARFVSLGMTPTVAESVAAAVNAKRWAGASSRSTAPLRSRRWRSGARSSRGGAKRPALAIIPSEDPYTRGPEVARRSAQRANAKIAVLEKLGHWWMCQDLRRGAAVLNEFYAGLE